MHKLYKKAAALIRDLSAAFFHTLYPLIKPQPMPLSDSDINDDLFWSDVASIVSSIDGAATHEDIIKIHQQIFDLEKNFRATRRIMLIKNQQDILYKKLSKKKDRIPYLSILHLSIN